MKKVININFQGQVIAIEETAYDVLKEYIDSLKNYFSREVGGDEIVNDIESRIAELFGNRLKHGISCITDEDVESVIASIGRPEDFDSDYDETFASSEEKLHQQAQGNHFRGAHTDGSEEARSLYRNENDKIIGGVCSGLAHYFKTDPVWVRIIFVLLFGFLFWVYLVLWIVLKPKALEANVAKRLYRNPTDRFLGGVCSGIAAYFKIETWIPRLLFVAPLLINLIGVVSFFPLNRIFNDIDFNWNVNGSMVVLYLVLWIIIPQARTVKQKLEMMGEEEYIQSIREAVNDNIVNVKNRTETAVESTEKPDYTAVDIPDTSEKIYSDDLPPSPPLIVPPKAAINATAQSGRSGCFHALGVFFKIIFFAFAGILAVAFMGMLIAFVAAGAKFVPLKSMFIDAGTESTLLWLSMALLLVVPVISIVVWIIRRSMKVKSRPAIGMFATALWIGGIVTATVLGLKIAEKFEAGSSTEKVQTLMPINGEKLYVDMEPYAEDYYSFSSGWGPGTDLDGFPYYTINEDSLLFSNIELKIIQSRDSLFHIRTIASVSGKDLKLAKSNTQQFSYPVVQQDSLLLLPEFFSTPIAQGYRAQGLTVEIAVPAGKKIEIDERLDDYDNLVSPAIRKKVKRNRHRSEALDWDYGEEYILRNGDLYKTTVTIDSI